MKFLTESIRAYLVDENDLQFLKNWNFQDFLTNNLDFF